jgi:tetratricopeptide (TPR) repeat protein
MRAAVLAVAALSLTVSLAAQTDDPHAACAAAPSYVPAALLTKPVGLRAGVGNSHEPVTTSSPEAQRFYDQGLNYLESYVWIEAARSFRQAIRLDPALAMAWLGLSRTYSGLDNPAGAKEFFDRAAGLADRVTPRERRRIEIRGRQLAALEHLEDAALFAAYKKSVDEALAADLDDPQLWILRGNAEEANASGRGQRGTASSVAFYERALQLVPDHATAHHYLVHTYETIGRIDLALEHGEAYARLAPSIPHAAHMWAHDLRRVGRIDEAIEQFRKANELEKAYYEAEDIDPGFDWHHSHNLDLLAACYEHKGQMKLAEQTMREAASLRTVDAARAFGRRELPGFLLRRGRYAEALAASKTLTSFEYAQSRAVGHVLAGHALIGSGRIADARTELEAAQRELASIPVVTGGTTPNRGAVRPWVEGLRGEILMRTEGAEEGRAILQEVQRALRAIPGPDAWTQTLFRLETIARAARESGDWTLARYTAEQMLEHDDAYAGSHVAMALALGHEGDEEGAARHFEAARERWKGADTPLAVK